MAAALAVVLVAGGTTAVLLITRNGQKDKPTGAPASAGKSAAAPAPAFPTDTILIRSDTGGERIPARKSKVYRLLPGTGVRSELPGTENGDVLPKWSHDRKQIAITHVSEDGTSSSIYVMNKDGSERREVVDGAGGRVAWSGDDKKIAFMKKANGVSQIFTLNLETGDLKQLTYSSTEKDDAAWSPDGKNIMYWLNQNKVKQIYELTVADPQEPGRRITGPEVGPANDPVYSPDGKQILYTRELNNGQTSDIWLVGRDGSNPHAVTSNPQREMDPTWSPDGTWFAHVRGDYARPTIVIQKPDGTGERLLTKPGDREGHPCWF